MKKINALPILFVLSSMMITACNGGGKEENKTSSSFQPSITACNHENMVSVPQYDPGCTTKGTKAHNHCPDCGKNFAETDLLGVRGEVSDSSLEIKATGHNEVRITDARTPTYYIEGTTEGKMCSKCEEVLEAQQPIAKKKLFDEVTVIDEDYPEWVSNLKYFDGIEEGGELVKLKKDYEDVKAAYVYATKDTKNSGQEWETSIEFNTDKNDSLDVLSFDYRIVNFSKDNQELEYTSALMVLEDGESDYRLIEEEYAPRPLLNYDGAWHTASFALNHLKAEELKVVIPEFYGEIIFTNLSLGYHVTTYTHAVSVAPTNDNVGMKEFYMNEEGTIVTDIPSEGVQVIDKKYSSAEVEAFLLDHPEYKIEKGDYNTYLFQSKDFIENVFDGAYDATADVEHGKASFKVGHETGEGEGEEYEPSNDTHSFFHFSNNVLKTLAAFGHRYVNFTIKAQSICTKADLNADRYAVLSDGIGETVSDGWKINYSEKRANLEEGVTLTIDLSLYNNFEGDYADAYYRVCVRDNRYPEYDYAMSNVVLSNIQLLDEDFSTYVNATANFTTVSYNVNENGLIDTIHVSTMSKPDGLKGFGNTTGLTPDYFAYLMKQNYKSINASINWNVAQTEEQILYFINNNGAMSYVKLDAVSINVVNEGKFYVAIPKQGGEDQHSGTIDVSFTYSSTKQSNLQIRDFYEQTQKGKDRYGLDVTLFGEDEITYDSSKFSASTGNVGSLVLTGGASVTIYNQKNTTSTPKDVLFYGMHMNIRSYEPQDGDKVVFTKGTYTDPSNQWNVSRSITLLKDFAFEWNSEDNYFVDSTYTKVTYENFLDNAMNAMTAFTGQTSFSFDEATKAITLTGKSVTISASILRGAYEAGKKSFSFHVESNDLVEGDKFTVVSAGITKDEATNAGYPAAFAVGFVAPTYAAGGLNITISLSHFANISNANFTYKMEPQNSSGAMISATYTITNFAFAD